MFSTRKPNRLKIVARLKILIGDEEESAITSITKILEDCTKYSLASGFVIHALNTALEVLQGNLNKGNKE